MNLFERYLTVWVALCIITGMLLGQFLPGVFQAVASLEVARANIQVGVLNEVPVMLLVVKIANASQGWYINTPGKTPGK